MHGVRMLEDFGIGAVAAANNMIVLMPQGDVDGEETNCWEGGGLTGDYPGYTGTDAWSRDGVQQKAIFEMIDRMKESASDDLEQLTEDSWDMPIGWLVTNGFFESFAEWWQSW